ncbi:long-chain-fatty-acid--protein ligase [Nonlabens xiamenensis]|uniref:acyl transferase n=1 Tax=Nonlabens xiamenensis TaxID=2341043 RepID=UPI001F0BEC24|nr:acyl transferase [Nonlabens xiamenensis]
MAWRIYLYQREHNEVYQKFCDLLDRPVKDVEQIPFLPISLFKSHEVFIPKHDPQIVFTSSGTTGMERSKHYVSDVDIYHQSLDKSFARIYGNPEDYVILALLPHYLERTGSSLVHMAQRWINQSNHPDSGFYLNELETLSQLLKELSNSSRKIILLGVSFALLALAEKFPQQLENTYIIETGGMKGMRKEIIKSELHDILRNAFPGAQIQSEYGMTELLSQAYALNGQLFETPPWMKVLTRQTNDPLSLAPHGRTGGINVIDLANLHSCSFIATQDLGKTHPNGKFEVLGRFDHSDIRGCNLMAVGSH